MCENPIEMNEEKLIRNGMQ